MYIDRYFGPVIPEYDWVPAPRYALRRNRILRATADWPKGRILEIGCGTGALLHEFALQGFDCTGFDDSPQAYEIACKINAALDNVTIVNNPLENWKNSFDYIFAFEVLEHIEDDLGALKQWVRWLVPGGRICISVPAHQRRWCTTDVFAGHFRRYERSQLRTTAEDAGLQVDTIECYGFPLANLIDPLRSWNHRQILDRFRLNNQDNTQRDWTRQSGVSRSMETRLFPIQQSTLGKVLFSLGFTLQRITTRTELGTGYLLLASRIK